MKPGALVLAALVAAATLGFYGHHLCPTTSWGDSAGLHLAVHDELGTGARSYPLFVALERTVGGLVSGNPYIGANLLTAFFGALAAAVLFGVVLRITGSVPAAVAGAASFAAAHTPWSYAVITEVYSLNHLFLALWILLLLAVRDGSRWAFVLLLFTAGLATAHHRLLGLFVVPFAVFVLPIRSRVDRRARIAGAIAFVVGCVPLAILAVRQLAEGVPPGTLVHEYLTGGMKKSVLDLDLAAFAKSVVIYAAYALYNLPGPAIVLIAIGKVSLWRRDRGLFALLAAVFLVYAVFAMLYRHHGIWVAYATHSYVPAAILVGIGADALLRRFDRRVLRWIVPAAVLLFPVVLYPLVPPILDRTGIRPLRTTEPERFHRWYFDPSRRGDTFAEDHAVAVLEAVPANAEILADWGVHPVLRLMQREGRAPGVRLHLDMGGDRDRWLEERAGPIFLAPFPYYEPRFDSRGFALERVSTDLALYRVVPKRTSR